MATQAAARQAIPGATPKLKILRIGIIQGGRIVEERLVRKRESITIGQSAKNTFVVLSDALPRNWLLFEASGPQYVAHFSDGMDARIAVGNEIISLSQLKQTGKIQKPEAFFFYQKSTINYDWQELKQDFIPRILDSVSRSPF